MSGPAGGRLVVVSNRLGDPSRPAKGGLAVALNGALNDLGGIWMGWSGKTTTGEVADDDRLDIRDIGHVLIAGVDIDAGDYAGYYEGFANSVLWPLFHGRLDLMDPQPDHLEAYRRVNALFARQLAGLLEPDDTLWVHDYHLIPLAEELRNLGVENRIGFFLHIPMPPSQLMAAVPGHEGLIRNLFHYDLVGFQTHADVVNFSLYTQRVMDMEPREDGRLEAFGRRMQVRAFPIGIDVEEFRELLDTEESRELVSRVGPTTAGRNLIAGVDRLDYSKGLPQRLRVFERLLEKYPEHDRQTTLVQIASPTRENVDAYAEIRDELDRLSGHVNGRFATIDWTPIRYIFRHVERARLAGLYSISRVGLVTPLRDGMNLVAKEFVAVQDDADPGVLVLSEFAGAAEEMTEALLVNPHDIESTADTVQRALTMPLAERRERHAALSRRVERGDVVTWSRAFLDALAAV